MARQRFVSPQDVKRHGSYGLGGTILFDETLKLILSGPTRSPAGSATRRLDQLFQGLARAADAAEASQIEELIWHVWMSHEDIDAEERLERAAQCIVADDDDEAEALLDELVSSWPDFAEAWNKRATLFFRQSRDAESVHDIHKTLELEPRHFGAMCGFGQICLRHGDRAAALFAFDAALKINPHLGAIRAAVETLASEDRGTEH